MPNSNAIFSHAINGVSWFLSSLFISYIFCPLFINIVKKYKNIIKNIIGIIITLLVILLLSYITLKFDYKLLNGKIDDITYGHPFIRCFYLLIGMFLANILLISNKRNNNHTIIEIIVIILYILYLIFRNILNVEPIRTRFIDITLTSLLIYIIASNNNLITKLLSKDKLVKLGNNSMYIFLIHYPVRMSIGYINNKINLYHYIGEYSFIVLLLIIILLIILSIKLYEKIEPYIRKKTDIIFNYLDKKTKVES